MDAKVMELYEILKVKGGDGSCVSVFYLWVLKGISRCKTQSPLRLPSHGRNKWLNRQLQYRAIGTKSESRCTKDNLSSIREGCGPWNYFWRVQYISWLWNDGLE